MAVTGRYLFTQPETIAAVVGVLLVYFATHLQPNALNDVTVNFLHVTSFALLAGMTFWVVFVAGLTMYRILPRHPFSAVQTCLFPKFFAYSVLFSAVALGTYYVRVKDQENVDLCYRTGGLLIVLVTSIINAAVAVPLNSAIAERNIMEINEKVGNGIADNNEGCKKMRETNEEYSQLYSRVVYLHTVSSLINIVTIVGIVLHLCTLCSNIVIR